MKINTKALELVLEGRDQRDAMFLVTGCKDKSNLTLMQEQKKNRQRERRIIFVKTSVIACLFLRSFYESNK